MVVRRLWRGANSMELTTSSALLGTASCTVRSMRRVMRSRSCGPSKALPSCAALELHPGRGSRQGRKSGARQARLVSQEAGHPRHLHGTALRARGLGLQDLKAHNLITSPAFVLTNAQSPMCRHIVLGHLRHRHRHPLAPTNEF